MAIAPVDTSGFTPDQLAKFNAANALGSGVQTYNSQTPPPTVASTPPATPPTVNVNVASQTSPTSTQPTQQNTTKPAQTSATALSVPANGSVVDLLNGAGQDSSFAGRTALAQQFGIQGYTDSKAQNTELAQKYTDFFNSKQGTLAPDANPRQEIQDGIQTGQQPDPQANLMTQLGAMNPVVKSLYDQIQQAISTPAQTQSYQEEFAKAFADTTNPAGTPGESLSQEQLQYMNIKNIMDGTEDDIRQEITTAGGFASESQVQALTATRNKVLLKQANVLQQSMQLKQDYVDQLMQFSQLDRKDVEDQVDRQIGLTEKLADITDKMNNAAKSNYQQIVSNVGYSGLAAALQGSPQQMAQAETVLGLAPGALSDKAFVGQGDAGKILGSASTGYFTYDPLTGETKPIGGGSKSNGSGGTSYKAGQLTQLLQSQGKQTDDATLSALWKQVGGQGNYVNDTTHNSQIYSSLTGQAGNGNIPTLTGKPLNDTQSTTLGYAQRLNDANTTISELGSQFTGLSSYLGAMLPNALKSSDRQQYEQAQRNFVNAVLRKESGAAISPGEFDSAAKQYFPQPGDSQAVIDQKTQNRLRVIGTLSQSANVPISYVTGSSQPSTSGGTYDAYLKAIGQ